MGAVWRGVAGVDLRSKYPDGKKIAWWAFSSTTKKLDTLLNPDFLGQSGVRTVFMIEIKSGVDIIRYSAFDDAEAEVNASGGYAPLRTVTHRYAPLRTVTTRGRR